MLNEQKKKTYATFNGRPNVLIDDYLKNIEDWENNGGIAIHHANTERTVHELTNLGFI